jgi:hypothetical protein
VKELKNQIKIGVVLIGVLLTMVLTALSCAASNPYGVPGAPDTSAIAGMAIMSCLIFGIIWLVVWILVAIWVYKDAEKRGKNGVLWLIIVIILGLIGLIIWLVVRGEKQVSSRHCPNCGRGIPEDARICPYCNKKFDQL